MRESSSVQQQHDPHSGGSRPAPEGPEPDGTRTNRGRNTAAR
ncbi:hypothetical protein ACFXAO_15235 [Streptomyces lavendulae]